MTLQKVDVLRLGTIDYKEAWDLQTRFHQEIVEAKLQHRLHPEEREYPPHPIHRLLLCQHPPVYTLGKSGSENNLIWGPEERSQKGIQFFKINRGGDITYHGPGQLVGYPIFDLECFFTDVHRYVRYLEEAVIQVLRYYGLEGIREQGYTGVWLEGTNALPKRKICAIGVHLSRWVTLHGFAFNINTDLSHFQGIIPCGISEADKSVTSMASELGRTVLMEEVENRMVVELSKLFNFEPVEGVNP
jgi:lipoyl(octanoyl) transferase